MKLDKYKLTTDIAWTMGGFVILAASGILINLIVVKFRDAAALGVFNLAYAVYLVASQIGVIGLHYSVLRHAALYENDPDERGRLLFTAGLCAVGLGTAAALCLWLLGPAMGAVFNSASTGDAIVYASFGLVLFPLNKVLISYVNALRLMKAFALLQSTRYIAVTIWVLAVAVTDLPIAYACFGFAAAELLTTLGAISYLRRNDVTGPLAVDRAWVARHFEFGLKILPAGLFAELNSRVDVLLLGLFVGEHEVGIYSFAAMLFDGLYHVLAMVRVNFNPLLVGATRDSDQAGLRRLLHRSKTWLWPGTAALSMIVAGTFLFIATVVIPAKGLLEGTSSLAILLGGLTLISAFIPLDNLLLASGRPGWQTAQHLTVVGSNVALNLLLVPLFGIEGAATATSLAYIAGITMLVIMVDRLMKWNLLTNRFGR